MNSLILSLSIFAILLTHNRAAPLDSCEDQANCIEAQVFRDAHPEGPDLLCLIYMPCMVDSACSKCGDDVERDGTGHMWWNSDGTGDQDTISAGCANGFRNESIHPTFGPCAPVNCDESGTVDATFMLKDGQGCCDNQTSFIDVPIDGATSSSCRERISFDGEGGGPEICGDGESNPGGGGQGGGGGGGQCPQGSGGNLKGCVWRISANCEGGGNILGDGGAFDIGDGAPIIARTAGWATGVDGMYEIDDGHGGTVMAFDGHGPGMALGPV